MSNETTGDSATDGAVVILTDADIVKLCKAVGYHITDRNEQNALLAKLCNGRRIRIPSDLGMD